MSMDPSLAEMLAARLCHDLGGAIGTLAGTLELVETAEDEMLGLARETAVALRDRLRLYSVAWGGGAEPVGTAAFGALLVGCSASPRVQFDLAGLAATFVLPAVLVPVALNAVLLAVEALPAGGVVSLAGDEGGLAVVPAGRRAAWPSEIITALAGAPPADLLAAGPRRVLVPLLLGQAARAGWDVGLGFARTAEGAPPLLLSPV